MDKQYYVKFCDLPLEEQEKFQRFLAKTARSCPIVEGERDCAWIQDYKEFKAGADPYTGLKISAKYAGKLGAVVENKKES